MRLLLIAALLPTMAFAAEPATPPAKPALGEAGQKLMAADTDGDGSWSKAEWTAAGRREQGFQMLDADRNGLVTRVELRDGLTKLRERRSR